jgi:putative transposase
MSHAVYDRRYHLLRAPKYHKWILKEKVRDIAKESFQEILAARDCAVEETEIAEDHVHIFTTIPPRYSVREMVRVPKSVTAREIFLFRF